MLICQIRDFKRTFFMAGLALLYLLSSVPLAAQEAGFSFPPLFDSRERLSKPDLSGISRLRFLTSLDFPPFSFADRSGRPSGFHIDLARAICDELEIADRCEIQAMPYDELQDALDRGEGDAILAGIAVTSKLRQDYLFSRPYMVLPARFLVRRKAGLAGPAATVLSGRSVGVLAGSAHEVMLKAWFPAAKAVSFRDRMALSTALKGGVVDAIFGDGVQLSFWAAGTDAGECCAFLDGPFVSDRFLGEGLTIMLPGNGDVLQQAMDHALLTLSREGRLNDLYPRYFPYGPY